MVTLYPGLERLLFFCVFLIFLSETDFFVSWNEFDFKRASKIQSIITLSNEKKKKKKKKTATVHYLSNWSVIFSEIW